MERRLYQICLEFGVTFVTISHRPALQACEARLPPAALFLALSAVSPPTQLGWADHEQMLAIGDGKCGFTLTDIDRSLHAKKTLAMAKACNGRAGLTRMST